MDHLQLKFLSEEHKLLKQWRELGLMGRPLVVAVSGGLDSIVLVAMLKRLRPVLKVPVYLAHIHHGPGSPAQVRYRDKAKKFVAELAEQFELPFLTNKIASKVNLRSEEKLREFRYRELKKIVGLVSKKEGAPAILVLAHHQDDLLETQMLRLVRGTGLVGLRGMEVLAQEKWRPLLSLNRDALASVAKKLQLKWLEDPSNQDIDPMRNWMRRKWLPLLEAKAPGAKASLARSLSLLARSKSCLDAKSLIQSGGIHRGDYLLLDRDEKRALMAAYLRKLKVRNYTQGQIEEICRRLDNGRAEYTFTLLKLDWLINAQRIRALKR